MAAAGCDLHADLTQLAVMWLSRAIANLPRFLQLLRQADRYFATQRPDAVILIDYPGFNWWIARRAKARGIPVIYYGVPQIWAWASHRISKMRRFVDHALVKLPFEEKWFRDRGCNATYVGHPYFDELCAQRLDEEFLRKLRSEPAQLVAILPGSRNQEVFSNIEALLKAAEKIASEVPTVRFAVAAFKESQADYIRAAAESKQIAVDVYTGRTPELINAAYCCLACSGSVSLELLFHAKPSVILYQVSRLGYFIQSMFRRVRYITLVNLLTATDHSTGRPASVYNPRDARDAHVLLPEYLSADDKSGELATHCIEWLTDPDAYHRTVAGLSALRDRVGLGGASDRAALYVLSLLAGDPGVKSAAA